MKLLTDGIDKLGSGFADEMMAELCWMFAVAHKDCRFFKPLRDKLFFLFKKNETIALACRRILPPLYRFLSKWEEWELPFLSQSYEIVVPSVYNQTSEEEKFAADFREEVNKIKQFSIYR